MYIIGTDITLTGNFEKVITGATITVTIEKPDGTTTDVTGIIVDGAVGTISYELTANANNMAGTWTFWAEAVLGGKVSKLEAVSIQIMNENITE